MAKWYGVETLKPLLTQARGPDDHEPPGTWYANGGPISAWAPTKELAYATWRQATDDWIAANRVA